MLRGVVAPAVRFFAFIGLSAFFYDVSDEPYQMVNRVEDNQKGGRLKEGIIHVRHSLQCADCAAGSSICGRTCDRFSGSAGLSLFYLAAVGTCA